MDRLPQHSWDPDAADIERLLIESPVRDMGMIGAASNYVFLLELGEDGTDAESAGRGYAIYKPELGETPLWDFPPALYRREIASYRLSHALGWALVPPTVLREDGLEHGLGSLQLYIPHDPRCSFFDLRDRFAAVMRRFALFDRLANNADRKGGHIILGKDGHVWGIDHGLTFHAEEKLRTVIWDYAGERVPEALLDDVAAFGERLERDSTLIEQMERYLHPAEVRALRQRAGEIVAARRFPQPPDWRRPYPWPLI